MSPLSLALLCSLTAAPAGHTPLPVRFAELSELAHDASRHPDAAAVVKLRAEQVLLKYTASTGEFYSQRARHEILAVQKEGGFELAEVTIPYWTKQKVLELEARVRQPDGTIEKVDASAMLSDTSGKGERSLNARFFRFPRVQLGSVLEYFYVIESESVPGWDDQDTVGRFPVERYAFELTASKQITLEAVEYNSRFPIAQTTLLNGDQRLSCELRDLPSRDAEDFDPHWTFVEPRWAWRTVAYHYPSRTIDNLRTWTDVPHFYARTFTVERDTFEGVSWKLEASDCADVPCKVDRARRFLFGKLRLSDRAWNDRDPLKDVVQSGDASQIDWAFLLGKLLRDEGLDVRLAFAQDAWTRQFDPNFPLESQFNHALVALPVQPGVKELLFIDPACPYCKLGALTARNRGGQAFMFRALDNVVGETTYEGEWVNLVTAAAPEAALEAELTAKVGLDGEVAWSATMAALGRSMLVEHARLRDSSEHAQRQERLGELKRLWPVARALRWSADPCDPQGERCTSRFAMTLRKHAVLEGERLLVPLSLLWNFNAEVFLPDTREQDIHFTRDAEATRETLSIEVPEGFRLTAPPPTVDVVGPLSHTRFSVEQTPTGARVRRVLELKLGPVPKARYAQLKRVYDAYRDARQTVLVFEKVK